MSGNCRLELSFSYLFRCCFLVFSPRYSLLTEKEKALGHCRKVGITYFWYPRTSQVNWEKQGIKLVTTYDVIASPQVRFILGLLANILIIVSSPGSDMIQFLTRTSDESLPWKLLNGPPLATFLGQLPRWTHPFATLPESWNGRILIDSLCLGRFSQWRAPAGIWRERMRSGCPVARLCYPPTPAPHPPQMKVALFRVTEWGGWLLSPLASEGTKLSTFVTLAKVFWNYYNLSVLSISSYNLTDVSPSLMPLPEH